MPKVVKPEESKWRFLKFKQLQKVNLKKLSLCVKKRINYSTTGIIDSVWPFS